MKKLLTIACAAIAALSFNSCNTADENDAFKTAVAERITKSSETPAAGKTITKPKYDTVYSVSSNQEAIAKISTIQTTIQNGGGTTQPLRFELKITDPTPLTIADITDLKNSLQALYTANPAVRIGLDFSSAQFDNNVITTSSLFGRPNQNLYLESFVFPSQVADGLSLGDWYFAYNPNLKYVQLPKNLAGFNYNGFYCYNPPAGSDLKVEIPASVKNLNNAFYNAQSLTEVILNEGLESINYGDFYYCINLKSIEIPGTVRFIDQSAFRQCSSLKKLVLKEGLQEIKTSAFQYAFSDDAEPFEIPSTVTTIGGYAFVFAKIKSLKIPATVTDLGDRIFEYCNKLETIELNTNYTKTYGALLQDCTALTKIVIGENVTNISKITYGASDFPNLSSVEFKNPKSWSVSGVGPIPEADLKDPATAAAKVKQYCDKTWTRSDS